MASILDQTDIYNGNVPPDAKVNPKVKGALYIENTTGSLYICIDNTKDKNKWSLVPNSNSLAALIKANSGGFMPWGDGYTAVYEQYSGPWTNVNRTNTTKFPILVYSMWFDGDGSDQGYLPRGFQLNNNYAASSTLYNENWRYGMHESRLIIPPGCYYRFYATDYDNYKREWANHWAKGVTLVRYK